MADRTDYSEFDARLHRVIRREPPPDQGRFSEACRQASCLALGLDPERPLGFLSSPLLRFACVVVAAWVAVIVITWRWAA